MDYSIGSDKLLEITYSPKLMSIVSIFPAEKPKTSYIERRNGSVSVNVAPAFDRWAYGKIPRLVLLYSCSLIMQHSQLVDFETRTIVFDESFRSFCRNSGLPYYGSLAGEVDDMLDRMLNTFVQIRGWFKNEDETIKAVANYRIFDYGEFHFNEHDKSKKTYIRFSKLLWRVLTEKCIPLNKEMASSLRSSRALDIYQWLSYRTYGLKGRVVVPWQNLRVQFEGDEIPMYRFKEQFLRALRTIQNSWTDLHVEILSEDVAVNPCKSSIRQLEARGKDTPAMESDVRSVTKDDGGVNPF